MARSFPTASPRPRYRDGGGHAADGDGWHPPARVAEKVIESGVAIAGIATALAIEPALPRNWREGRPDVPVLKPIAWKNKQLASTAHMAAVKYQLARLSRRQGTVANVSPIWALVLSQAATRCRAKRYRRWMATRNVAA